jgi:putative sterol carrier protein
MASPTEEFFTALEKRGHEPLLEKVSGTVRIDAVSGEQTDHWFVRFHKGDIAVSREDSEADCVVRADIETLDRINRGEANAFAMVLRGAVHVEGNAELLVLFQRLFPGPPGQREQPTTAGYARRQS